MVRARVRDRADNESRRVVQRITPPEPNSSRGRVIGVIDLLGGLAVHARGGNRASYLAVADAAGTTVAGSAVALARVYTRQLGVRELYVADLDAIVRGPDALQADVLSAIARVGAPLLVDAGVSTVESAHRVLDAGAAIVVVGLETLHQLDALEPICLAVGGSRVAFSLDLRDGVPVAAPNADHRSMAPLEIAVRAARAGAGTIIVLDVARVGTGQGVDLGLLTAIRRAAPDVAVLVGGGVRDAADLAAIHDAGGAAALVATALLSGALDV
jgi:phosphoribosylformimino-5-aminoimidazole carboxamide ribotide isomerase